MDAMLIRGRYVIRDADSAAIADGAVAVERGRVAAIGRYADLRGRYGNWPTLGSDAHLVLPGFVNSHSHGKGLGTFELGFLDDQLEMWILARKGQRQPDV